MVCGRMVARSAVALRPIVIAIVYTFARKAARGERRDRGWAARPPRRGVGCGSHAGEHTAAAHGAEWARPTRSCLGALRAAPLGEVALYHLGCFFVGNGVA